MNRSLEPHDHPDGAECAGLHDTLLTIIDHNEPLPVLRYCLTVIELVLQHHPTFCTELRYAVGVAQELSMDSDAAEICYAEMIERGDHTASTRARYMTYRYRQLTIRIATCPPEARDYFNARALVASDEVAPSGVSAQWRCDESAKFQWATPSHDAVGLPIFYSLYAYT